MLAKRAIATVQNTFNTCYWMGYEKSSESFSYLIYFANCTEK